MWGYIVEYGEGEVTVPADTCTADGPGCNPTGAQIFQLPPTAELAPGATLTARVTTIHDDPSRCGNQPLTLFDGAVVIPPYLCGHPDFIVIETHTEGVEVLERRDRGREPDRGSAAEQSLRLRPGAPEPGRRSSIPILRIATWSRGSRRIRSRCSKPRAAPAASSARSTEVTYACGSSRGKVLSGSYHFVGLRIHPGPGNELADGNPAGNHQSFIDLTRYKLAAAARFRRRASKGALPKLRSPRAARAARWRDLRPRPRQLQAGALNIKLFLKAVEHVDATRTIAGENFNGEHLMRGSNIEFMYAEKILPFD